MNHEILTEALACRQRLAAFRAERRRNKDYVFGRQWNDIITVNGQRITEREYIISEGNIPLQNNLIRRIVRNVLGVFRSRLKTQMESWTPGQLAFADRNCLPELFPRVMEEYLISGMAVCRRWSGERDGVCADWIDAVSPEAFFFDSSCGDLRGWDVQMLGQFHDVTPGEWCDAFVRTPEDYRRLRERIRSGGRAALRVVEVWRQERRPRCLFHDRSRGVLRVVEAPGCGPAAQSLPPGRLTEPFLDKVWRFYFLDMEGNVLREGDSPYRSGHPYVFKAYPFLDGEIHSFVHDIIDQQRYANRLITLYDWVMRASAKGVLMLPEGCVDAGDIQDVADQWGRFNGVIVYKPSAGEPHQVSASANHAGIGELLDIQLKMLEDVSGVNGALQGNVATASMSGTLYNQQTQNSLTSLADLLDSFLSFVASTLPQLKTKEPKQPKKTVI